MPSLKDMVVKAIETYNRYRSPLVTAKLVEVEEGLLTIDFEGSYCRACGVYDYFEDFIYELMDLADLQLEILSYEPQGPESFRVRYTVKGQPKKQGIDQGSSRDTWL